LTSNKNDYLYYLISKFKSAKNSASYNLPLCNPCQALPHARQPKDEPQKDKGTYHIKPDGAIYITWQHWNHATPIQAYFFDTMNAYVVIDNNPVFHTACLKSEMKAGNHL
jgi:hypothetical protein